MLCLLQHYLQQVLSRKAGGDSCYQGLLAGGQRPSHMVWHVLLYVKTAQGAWPTERLVGSCHTLAHKAWLKHCCQAARMMVLHNRIESETSTYA